MQDRRQTETGNLLSRVAGGDRAAFDQLYQRTSAQLHALGVSILKDRPAAEDALEQVFLRIWSEAGQQPDSGLSPMAWLVVLTRDMAVARMEAEGLPGAVTRPSAIEAIWLEGATLPALARRDGFVADGMRARIRAELAQMAGTQAAPPSDVAPGKAPQPEQAEGRDE